jgi:hypothetical protein
MSRKAVAGREDEPSSPWVAAEVSLAALTFVVCDGATLALIGAASVHATSVGR